MSTKIVSLICEDIVLRFMENVDLDLMDIVLDLKLKILMMFVEEYIFVVLNDFLFKVKA